MRYAYRKQIRPGEADSAFLRRVTESESEFEAFIETLSFNTAAPLETIETSLRKIKNDFEDLSIKWDGIVQSYFETDAIQNLDPNDALWLRKAYTVMVNAQPVLDFHDLYGVVWVYPDIERVLRKEEFEIPETEEATTES
jgi:hypothetical protein